MQKRTATGAAARMARAQLLAQSNSTREEEAAFIYHKYTADSGKMSEEELLRCFGDLGFSNGRQHKTEDEQKKWVRQELRKGDKAGDGKLSVSGLTPPPQLS